MARQDRNTLRRYFQNGAKPSSAHFNDFIESTLNMRDEGFSKSPDFGLEISAQSEGKGLLSFFTNATESTPNWTLNYQLGNSSTMALRAYDNSTPLLAFVNYQATNAESVGRLGINTPSPNEALDVNGFVQAKGLIGSLQGEIPADSQYHDITDELEGCNGFEVMAGVGVARTGIYGLVHAIALNTYYPRKWYDNLVAIAFFLPYRVIQRVIFGVKDPQSNFYRGRRGISQTATRFDKGRIKLRWLARGEKYVLQAKTVCNCDQELVRLTGDQEHQVVLQYHIKSLWKDNKMFGSKRRKAVDESA
ncbi:MULTISPECIES: hypothetical protein [unclassified Agarivorans]|uniref:hypothetical protein n=1 Tax=unclassified Agarivorans TaxID=2636026 RepID=UPI0026E1FDEF|nr:MULTISPECIES: hypothetical protein [unclassified Agarivorans]MDO6686773.1 hypothetical protein [Agarivorans sp. 3_MG-2023]MDO6716497.1 hypothetical protein [Agarivorans sp. 2_MG-2023]